MVLVRAEAAQKPQSDHVKIVAWIYTAILVVMIMAQLVAFSDFILLMSSTYKALNLYGTAVLVSCLIAIVEVFAVPSLLRMVLSPLMRWLSLLCGMLTGLIWLILSIEASVGTSLHTNSGLLGTKVSIMTGVMAILTSSILLILSLYVTWGLWPTRHK